MNWEAIGAFGEVLGSVLVLVTLLYLARQLKETKLAIRSSVLQSRSEQRIEFALTIMQNSEMVDLFAKFLSPTDHTSITLQDIIRYRQYLHAAHAGLENVFQHHVTGQVDDATFRSNRIAAENAMNTNLARLIWPQMKNAFDTDYQKWVDRVLEQTSPVIEIDESILAKLMQ